MVANRLPQAGICYKDQSPLCQPVVVAVRPPCDAAELWQSRALACVLDTNGTVRIVQLECRSRCVAQSLRKKDSQRRIGPRERCSMPNRTLKETLRQLLEAEDAGRQAAAELEAAGDEIAHKARAEGEKCAQAIRLLAEREIAELERQVQTEIEEGCQAVAHETDATIERLKTQATGQRVEAVKKVVAMLLGEEEANR